jgi:hypothetical protein
MSEERKCEVCRQRLTVATFRYANKPSIRALWCPNEGCDRFRLMIVETPEEKLAEGTAHRRPIQG